MMFMVSDKRNLKEFSKFAPKIRFKIRGKGRDMYDATTNSGWLQTSPFKSVKSLSYNVNANSRLQNGSPKTSG